MRTERTEFVRLDEVFRRLALSHFGVALHLRHNRAHTHASHAVHVQSEMRDTHTMPRTSTNATPNAQQ